MNVLRDFNTGHLLNLLETSCQAEDETAGLITLGDRVAFDASHIRTGPARIDSTILKKYVLEICIKITTITITISEYVNRYTFFPRLTIFAGRRFDKKLFFSQILDHFSKST